MCEVTDHATESLHTRAGLPKSAMQRMADKALAEGLMHKDVAGNLKRYLDGLYLSHHKANNMRIYSNKVFIFHDEVLITILDLPSKYFKTVNKIKANRV